MYIIIVQNFCHWGSEKGRNVPSGEELGEMSVFAGLSRLVAFYSH